MEIEMLEFNIIKHLRLDLAVVQSTIYIDIIKWNATVSGIRIKVNC